MCNIILHIYKKRMKRFNPFPVNTSKCDLVIEHLGVKNNTIINKKRKRKQSQRHKQYYRLHKKGTAANHICEKERQLFSNVTHTHSAHTIAYQRSHARTWRRNPTIHSQTVRIHNWIVDILIKIVLCSLILASVECVRLIQCDYAMANHRTIAE